MTTTRRARRSKTSIEVEDAHGWLRLPTVSLSAEHLVMGHLMRRNVLAYKAPPGNEGYDLICIHPDPRHRSRAPELPQVRIQVKSRYSTDCNRSFPLKARTLNAFDFLVVVFLNIGKFSGGRDGTTGAEPPEFYALPRSFIRRHHDSSSSWEKVHLRGLEGRIEKHKDEQGFEQIADALGVRRPRRPA